MYEGALVAGRYRLEARIGAGSMGQVWRALDERLQREVAVKTVDLSQANEAVTPERVRREVIATARLNHPNIVTIFDAGTDADIAFLVMELLSGQSLAQLVRAEGVLEVGQVVDIGLQVSRALESTHAIGIVHRDIKPANIMVVGSTAKILDFGIAQLTQENAATLTGPATALGTAAYMSPEQAVGGKAGPPTDIYSLGCVLMALLTGQPPFVGHTSVEVANRQINDAPPRVSDRRPDVPAVVDDLVGRMLAKDPAARPTARQLSDAFLALRRGASAEATAILAGGAAAPPGATSVLPGATAVLPGATSVLPGSGPGQTRVAPADATVGPGRGDARVGSARLRGADDGSATSPQGPNRWFGKGLRWIVLAIVVVVVIATVWVAGSALVRQASSAISARPTPARTSTRTTQAPGPVLPSINLPTISAPTLPSANTAARRAAVGTVTAALNALSPSTEEGQSAKERLIASWEKAGDNIVAGKNASRELTKFGSAVEKAHEQGALSDAESTALLVALQGVAALV